MDVNKLTLGDIKEIQALVGNAPKCECPWKVGEKYFLRTVTMYFVGELKWKSEKEFIFKNASWVSDTGRFHTALKKGEISEVEPFLDDVTINRDCIIDSTIWRHELPMEQK